MGKVWLSAAREMRLGMSGIKQVTREVDYNVGLAGRSKRELAISRFGANSGGCRDTQSEP
jgi:hypothetical protein